MLHNAQQGSLAWQLGNRQMQMAMWLLVGLQANYILVKGGSLRVGREDAPFPGSAKITLHGSPDARELPLYGAKVCNTMASC